MRLEMVMKHWSREDTYIERILVPTPKVPIADRLVIKKILIREFIDQDSLN